MRLEEYGEDMYDWFAKRYKRESKNWAMMWHVREAGTERRGAKVTLLA